MNFTNLRLIVRLGCTLSLALLVASCGGQSSGPSQSQGQQGGQAPSPAPVASAPMQAVAAPFTASGNGQYEQPPVVNASDLLPASSLSGNGYQVQPQVPTNGAMGQYTIVADQNVFGNDAGA